MKSDHYLNLCLEQASKSPLRYQHGCVIVRGGKVIGQGYNDYRPGFCSGTIKDGRTSSNSSQDSPLSMHAEMMAIQSALCRKVSCMDFQHEKQGGDAARSSKSKRAARQQALQDYVEAVCAEGPTGLCHVQAQCFEEQWRQGEEREQECFDE